MWDNTNNWIFLHPKKCAGSSIEIVLREKFRNSKCEPDNSQHWSIKDIITHLDKPLNDYLIFTCARNPWDRMVSLYYHMVTHDNYTKNFKEFIRERGHYHFRYEQMPLKFYFDNCDINFVVKHESFDTDFKQLMLLLNIQDYAIPHFAHNTNRPSKDYRSYYDKDDIDFITYQFSWDIEHFNYRF